MTHQYKYASLKDTDPVTVLNNIKRDININNYDEDLLRIYVDIVVDCHAGLTNDVVIFQPDTNTESITEFIDKLLARVA